MGVRWDGIPLYGNQELNWERLAALLGVEGVERIQGEPPPDREIPSF